MSSWAWADPVAHSFLKTTHISNPTAERASSSHFVEPAKPVCCHPVERKRKERDSFIKHHYCSLISFQHQSKILLYIVRFVALVFNVHRFISPSGLGAPRAIVAYPLMVSHSLSRSRLVGDCARPCQNFFTDRICKFDTVTGNFAVFSVIRTFSSNFQFFSFRHFFFTIFFTIMINLSLEDVQVVNYQHLSVVSA